MKPTKTQKAIIDAIIQQLNYWKSTNDIDSPTNISDLHEELKVSTEDYLSSKERYCLEYILLDLFTQIKEFSI